jgi:hypothetical protein
MNAMRKFEVVKSDLAPMAAHPEYAAEAAKLAELKARRETVRMEIGEVDRAISLRVLADDEDAMSAKAIALLDGGTLPDNDDLVTKLRQLREMHAVLGRAITMQRKRLADIAERLSDDAAEAAEGEHRAATARLLAAVRELLSACEAETAARNRVTGAGYHARLPAMAPHIDRHSGIGAKLYEIETRAMRYVEDR